MIEKGFTPREIAEAYDVQEDTVYGWINHPDPAQRLQAVDFGKASEPRWRATQAMLDDFFARRAERVKERLARARILDPEKTEGPG